MGFYTTLYLISKLFTGGGKKEEPGALIFCCFVVVRLGLKKILVYRSGRMYPVLGTGIHMSRPTPFSFDRWMHASAHHSIFTH